MPDYMSPDRQHRLALPRNDEDPYQLASLPAGRELDAEVAKVVFGASCIHKPVRVPVEELIRRARATFLREYGTDAPPTWEGDAAGEYDSDYAPKWCEFCHEEDRVHTFSQRTLPHYSTDIAAAWQVFEWIRSQRDTVFVCFDSRDDAWEVEACDHIDYKTGLRDDGSKPRGCAVVKRAETAPLAICLSALALAARPQPGA